MDEKQLKSYLAVIVPRILELLTQRKDFSEQEAIQKFYNSDLYETLEKEETKLWHFGAETLYALLDQELTTGHIIYPEEI